MFNKFIINEIISKDYFFEIKIITYLANFLFLRLTIGESNKFTIEKYVFTYLYMHCTLIDFLHYL